MSYWTSQYAKAKFATFMTREKLRTHHNNTKINTHNPTVISCWDHLYQNLTKLHTNFQIAARLPFSRQLHTTLPMYIVLAEMTIIIIKPLSASPPQHFFMHTLLLSSTSKNQCTEALAFFSIASHELELLLFTNALTSYAFRIVF